MATHKGEITLDSYLVDPFIPIFIHPYFAAGDTMPHLKTSRMLLFFLFSSFLIMGVVQSQGSSPLLNATLADSLLLDRDGDGRLDAGDVLRYTLDIVNCGPGTAENVQFTGQRDLNTQFMPSSVQVGQPIPALECAPPAVVAPPADSPTSVPPPVDTVATTLLRPTSPWVVRKVRSAKRMLPVLASTTKPRTWVAGCCCGLV